MTQPEVWLQAVAVIDVSSVAYDVAAARRRRRPVEPRVDLILHQLRRAGIEVVEVVLAHHLVPVKALGRPSSPPHAMHRARSARAWAERQAAHIDVPIVLAPGAHDGSGEIGVDEAAIAQTLLRLQANPGASLVILSADSDLQVLADYVEPEEERCAYVVRATLSPGHRKELDAEGRGWIALGQDAYAHMAPGWAGAPPSVLSVTGDAPRLVDDHGRAASSDLACASGRHLDLRVATGTATIVIVDAFGIANSSARAIGAGLLPTRASTEDVLRELGLDGPMAFWFVVPDVPGHALGRLPHRVRSAWQTLDNTFDGLRHSLEHDDDPLTSVVASRLRPDRTSWAPDRRWVEEKLVSTAIAGDIVHALVSNPDATVVVLSDRPEMAMVTSALAAQPGFADRLVRVGVHARTIEALDRDAVPPTWDGGHVIELTQSMLARLTRVDGQHTGAALRRSVRQVTVPTTWQVARYDAVSCGLVLRHPDDAQLEIVLTQFLNRPDEQVRQAFRDGLTTSAELQLTLSLDVHTPCAIPSVTTTTDGPGGATLRLALVTAVDEDGIHLDIDGDQVADGTASTAHDSRSFTPGDIVVIAGSHRPFALLSTVDALAAEADICVIAVGADGRVSPVDGDAQPGALVGLTRFPRVQVGEGARLLAHPVGDGSYRAISTALPHLQVRGTIFS